MLEVLENHLKVGLPVPPEKVTSNSSALPPIQIVCVGVTASTVNCGTTVTLAVLEVILSHPPEEKEISA